jgi:tetratricopeptide (TPR) repeat protein
MHTRLIIGVIASLGSFTLAFEATGVESSPPNFGTSSSSDEISIRLDDGQDVRVGRKLAALIAEGGAASLRGHYAKAISLFTAALKANPHRDVAFVIYSSRASLYYAKRELHKALSDSTAAIQLNSNSAIAYLGRGHVYKALADDDKAINDYSMAIRLDPKNWLGYYSRAIVYGQKRQYPLAIRDSTSAIRLNSKRADAYNNRGVYYSLTSKYNNAIADFNEAIRLNLRDSSTLLSRATVYENFGKFDKAIADYDRVIQIPPRDSDNYVARGKAYECKGNYRAALSDFKKAVQLSPNSPYALRGLAWFRATCPEAPLRNGKQAIRMSMKACELTKWKEPGDFFILAAAYAETGDFDKALKYQTQAINAKIAYGPVDKKTREHLALYQAHKPARSEPLVAR